jgi:hypothetical protein
LPRSKGFRKRHGEVFIGGKHYDGVAVDVDFNFSLSVLVAHIRYLLV